MLKKLPLMLRPIDNWFLTQSEPLKGTLQFLRSHLLQFDPNITESWKYGAPFYNYKGKRFAYLWVDKKRGQPYIGIVDGYLLNHPYLLQEDRKRMKIFLIDADKDLPVKKINAVLKEVLSLYKN